MSSRLAFGKYLLLIPLLLAAGCAARVWEPARWQRTMVATKQAEEQGNVAEAERLCVEALQYVDASAVRSLDEYASLLQALKREIRTTASRPAVPFATSWIADSGAFQRPQTFLALSSGAWDVAMATIRAILRRESLLDEDEMINGMLRE